MFSWKPEGSSALELILSSVNFSCEAGSVTVNLTFPSPFPAGRTFPLRPHNRSDSLTSDKFCHINNGIRTPRPLPGAASRRKRIPDTVIAVPGICVSILFPGTLKNPHIVTTDAQLVLELSVNGSNRVYKLNSRAGWNLKINFGDLDINLLVQVVFLLFVRIQMIICMIPDDNNFKNRSENLLRFTICPGLSVQILYYLPRQGRLDNRNERTYSVFSS